MGLPLKAKTRSVETEDAEGLTSGGKDHPTFDAPVREMAGETQLSRYAQRGDCHAPRGEIGLARVWPSKPNTI